MMTTATEMGTNITRAAALLRQGEVVGIPTETVYGLAGNALNREAVAAIFAVKNRPSFDPLIIHVGSPALIEQWTLGLPEALQALANAFMPGPLTLLLDKQPAIPDLVTAGLPRVAIRVPDHPLTLALLAELDFPLAAPSANPFGYISPTSAQHVVNQLNGRIPYVLDGGPCSVGLESTIVGLEEGRPTVFRKGGLAVETIEALIGPVAVREHSTSNPQAPGMLKSHYAPRMPLVLADPAQLPDSLPPRRVGVLAFREAAPWAPAQNQQILSPDGNLQQAASRLFAALRYLDELDIDLIVAELVPERDLGRAINDRLRRAAAEPLQ